LVPDDITLEVIPLQQQGILAKVEAEYVQNNALIIDKIKKLEDAVIVLINKEENDTGFVHVHNKIIKPTIEKMKFAAEQHKKFINDNKTDQIASVSSSKGEDIFLFGVDMLQNIENITEYNTIQVQLKNKYPIKNITNNNLNVISGGQYRSFTEDKLETKKEDASTNINYKHFYDNITGSSLLNSKQAMLIALYAQLNNINIVTNYGDVLAKLKAEGIMDYESDSNFTIKPIKNSNGTSPLMVDGKLVEPTAGYEFGGKRNTKGNDNKKIYDCSSWIEDLYATCTLTTGDMFDAISKETDNDFRNKILTKATRILHYDTKNNTDIMSNLEDGDMFVWRGHVGFVKIIDGNPQMLSYARERGEGTPFNSVNKRTDEHFKGKRTNIDGFTLEGAKSFEELIKKKDLYIIKFDPNKEGADIPTIEESEKNNTLCR
jgi:hypothetical protein